MSDEKFLVFSNRRDILVRKMWAARGAAEWDRTKWNWLYFLHAQLRVARNPYTVEEYREWKVCDSTKQAKSPTHRKRRKQNGWYVRVDIKGNEIISTTTIMPNRHRTRGWKIYVYIQHAADSEREAKATLQSTQNFPIYISLRFSRPIHSIIIHTRSHK